MPEGLLCHGSSQQQTGTTSNWWRTHPVLFRRDARGKKTVPCPDKGAETPGLKTDWLGRRDKPHIPPRKEE
ncbi:hypothetical protein SY86_13150 [Erwinia tracheiphila]|uniref:Uncharacterized protein n=1 Tax=Erwinia tracheiphila TaxID=65700 RepID=A0A0M2KG33_9GAMM|nr:hypothetical protein SY86_13150 [Erwinia tracheiphila]